MLGEVVVHGPQAPCTVFSMPKMRGPDVLYLGPLSELYLQQTTSRDEVVSLPGQIPGLLPIVIKVIESLNLVFLSPIATYRMSRHPLKRTGVTS